MIQFKKILCQVDFFPGSLLAFDYALNLASNYGSRVVALHVVQPVMPAAYGAPVSISDMTADMERESRRLLAKLKAQGEGAGIPVDTMVVMGDVDHEIDRAIGERKADLVVMGSHGRRGFERLAIGSVAERTIRRCPVPILVVGSARPGTTRRSIPPRIPRILVTTDFSAGTRDALAAAFSIAQECQSRVTLLHAAPEAGIDVATGPLLVDASRKQLEALVPPGVRDWCRVETRVAVGDPYPEIVRFAESWKPGLLVMNIHGKGMIERALLGSTAERVLRSVGNICPVLLIPPKKKRAASRP
jgi:nucleotide-binding universal stress UspA family protein